MMPEVPRRRRSRITQSAASAKIWRATRLLSAASVWPFVARTIAEISVTTIRANIFQLGKGNLKPAVFPAPSDFVNNYNSQHAEFLVIYQIANNPARKNAPCAAGLKCAISGLPSFQKDANLFLTTLKLTFSMPLDKSLVAYS